MLKTAGKLAPEAKPRVVNLLFQAFFVYSRVAYTIFPNSCGKRRLRRRFPSLVMKNFIPNLCVKA